jgi:hypothetical protein
MGHSYTDAAGNETRITRPSPIKVDNNAPAAPVGPSSPAPSSQDNNFSAYWALPADSGTPIAAARWQVCQNDACGAVHTAEALTAVSGISLPSPGSGTLRVWLADEAGHEDPATAATLTLTYAPPAARAIPTTTTTTSTTTSPPPSTNPAPPPPAVRGSAKLKITTVRRKGRTITVAGTLSARASGRVTVRYRSRLHGRTRALARRATIMRHAFKVMLKLPRSLAAARTGTITVAYGGDADTRSQSAVRTLRVR